MEKKGLIKLSGGIYRVLAIQDEEVLLIDCLKRNMPKWWELADICGCDSCTEDELLTSAGVALEEMDKLDAEARRTAYQRYTIVASVLPFIENDKQRIEAVKRVAEDNRICRQTVRNYLCLYLSFQSVAALAPEERGNYQKPLTDDEKIFRWAINKFYFTSHKNSLKTCYTYMLKEKYCDTNGTLLAEHPSYNQFRYFFPNIRKCRHFTYPETA